MMEVPPHIQEMLVENRRRMDDLSDGFNPLTGYRSVGERRRVDIPDFPIRTQWLPVEMLDDPFVADMISLGFDNQCRIISNSDNPTDVQKGVVLDQFFRLRYRYDMPFWSWLQVRIHPKGSGEDIPFRLNRAQRRLIERLERMRKKGKPIRLVLLKARQWGGSTATQVYMAWLQLIVLKGANSIIVGHVKDSSTEVKDMLTKLLDAYDTSLVCDPNSPFFTEEQEKLAKEGLYHGSSSSANIFYVKSRNCKFKIGTAEKPNSARGGDSTLAHCTEVGLWVATDGKTPEDIVTSVTGGISYKPNTMIVYESTAKGTGNFFHRIYTTAKQAELNGTFNQFERMFVNWYEIGWKNMLPFRDDQEYLKQNALEKISRQLKMNVTEDYAQNNVPWFDFYLPDYIMEDAPAIEDFAQELYDNRFQTEAPDATREPGAYLWRLWEQGATLQGIYWYVCERTKYHDHADMASETPSDDIEAFQYAGAKVFSEYDIEKFRPSCKIPTYTGDIVASSIAWNPTGLRPGKEILTNLKFVPERNGLLKVWHLPDEAKVGEVYRSDFFLADNVDYTEAEAMAEFAKLPPKIANRYLVIVDIGGKSNKSDWSVIVVIDRYWMMDGGKPEVVAQWRGHIHHDLLAWKAVQIAKYYDNALLVIESNTLETRDKQRDVDGDASDFILNQIKNCYDNLYERTPDNENIVEGAPHKYGFHTNVKTKVTVILNLQHVVREQLYVERDELCLHEYSVYEKNAQTNAFGAIAGEHDDILMTRAIGLYICFCEMPLPYVIRIERDERPDFSTAMPVAASQF